MVQRKADTCNKKPSLNNLDSSSSSSSSSLHRHHAKNNVRSDLKWKVMKRSGSFKRQEQSAVIEGDSTPRNQSNDRSLTMTPNYMKSTSSSTAKKEQSAAARTNSLRGLTKNPCFKSTASKKRCSEVVALCEDMKMDDVVRKPTCSSTLRHCKFPDYLELSRGGTESSGTSAFKVCPYTYCSLNGHCREPLPPLKMFLSAKRRAMKASLKGSKLSYVRDELKEEKNLIKEAFDQTEDADMELETNMESDVDDNGEFEYEYSSSQMNIVESEFKGIECDDASQDSTYVDSDAFSYRSNQTEAIYDNPESLNDAKAYESVEPEPEEDPNQEENKPEIEMEPWANQDSKKIISHADQMGDFNLRGPNFLPLEPDPDAEKVDLKHQEVDERKNSEEFMVDYALRQAVTKLAPARKRKVALLVEAFEKVMPEPKPEIHSRQGSRFDDHARVVQACN